MTGSGRVGRAVVAAAAVCAASLAPAAVGARPAAAHGAATEPVSRAAVCGLVQPRSAVCRAAVEASGGRGFADTWDELRLAGVDGRDRERVPDGELCSGGLAAYRGLDLSRADWPATALRPGARLTFRYRETIPHQGTFRLYLTKDGYLPTRPLRWSDLEPRPFLTVTNPPRRARAYVFSGTLPANRAGRHLIYTIWQNSSTPDTYYSCSDVVFAAPAPSPEPAAARPPASAAPSTLAAPSMPAASGGVGRLGPAQPLSTTDSDRAATGPLVAAGLAVLAAAGAVVAGVLIRRRRRTPDPLPGREP
jgi:predicted carbohydrate-binding protein with CBM5 and CBM33 domain